MSRKLDLFETPCSSQTVHVNRDNLNNVESLSDLCFEVYTELLSYANSLRQSEESFDESTAVVVGTKEENNRFVFSTVWKERN